VSSAAVSDDDGDDEDDGCDDNVVGCLCFSRLVTSLQSGCYYCATLLRYLFHSIHTATPRVLAYDS